eukprot:EG_transcript_576
MENAALEALLFASKQISGQNAFAVLLQDEALAVKFFAQLFQERYGWSETTDVVDGMNSSEVQERKRRNEQLDRIITQIQDLTISGPLLVCFAQCIAAAQRLPVVKEHAFHHFFAWMGTVLDALAEPAPVHGEVSPAAGPKMGCRAFLLRQDRQELQQRLVAHFEDIQELMVRGLTDVWSVIRKQSAGRIRGFCERLPMNLVKELFQRLVAICKAEGSTWQEVEGALLGMNAIMRNFKWEELGENDSPTSPVSPFPPPDGATPASHPIAVIPPSAVTSPSHQVRVIWSPSASSGPGRLVSVPVPHAGLSGDEGAALPADPLGLRSPVPYRRRAHSDPWLLATGNKRRRCLKELQRKARNKKLLWLAFEGERFDEEAMDGKPSLPPAPVREEQNPSMRYLRFGRHKFSFLPPYIADGLIAVLYQMLAHPQLSVRDVASRLVCNFLSRSQFSETVLAFKHVIQHLRGSDSPSPGDPPPDPGRRRLLGAFEAEGFVRLACMLVRKLPSEYLTTNWEKYSPVLDAYLAHPACTVRQETSQIYHVLVMKDSDDPCMPLCRRVLPALIGDWQPQAAQPAPPSHRDGPLSPVEAPAHSACWSMPSSSWQWREGRLLAYELILDYFTAQHISTAFPLSAFPEAMSPLSSPNASECHLAAPAFISPPHGSTPPSVAALPRLIRPHTPDSVQFAQVSPGSAHPLSKTMSFGTLRNMAIPHGRPYADQAEGMSVLDRLLVCLQEEENLRRASCDLSGGSDPHPPPNFSASASSAPAEASRTESTVTRTQDVGLQLRIILLQSLESSLEEQWELQRMAHQVVPLCVEAIFYFDADLLISAIEQLLLEGEDDDTDSSAAVQGCALLRHAAWKAVVVDYCVGGYVDAHGRPQHWCGPLPAALGRARTAVRQFRCRFAHLLPRALRLALGRARLQATFDAVHALLIAASYLRLSPDEAAGVEELALSDPSLAEFSQLFAKGEEHLSPPSPQVAAEPVCPETQGLAQSWRDSRPPPLRRHSSSALTGHSLFSSMEETLPARPAGFYLKAVLLRLLELCSAQTGQSARTSTKWSGSVSSRSASHGTARPLFPHQLAQDMASLFPDLVLESSLEDMSFLLQLLAALLRVRDEVHLQNLLLEAMHRVYHFLGAYLRAAVRGGPAGEPPAEDSGFAPFSFVSDPSLACPTITETELHATSQAMLRIALSARQKAASQPEGGLPLITRQWSHGRTRHLRPDSAYFDTYSEGTEDRGAPSPPALKTRYRVQLPTSAPLDADFGPATDLPALLLPPGELEQRTAAVLAEVLPLLARRTLELSITRRALEVLQGAFLAMGDLRFLPGALDSFHARLTSEKPSVFDPPKKAEGTDTPGQGLAPAKSSDEDDSDWDSDGGSWDECTGEFDRLAAELTQFVVFLQDHFS